MALTVRFFRDTFVMEKMKGSAWASPAPMARWRSCSRSSGRRPSGPARLRLPGPSQMMPTHGPRCRSLPPGPSHKPMVRPSRSMGQRRNKSAGTKRSSPCRRTGILSVQLTKRTMDCAPSPLVPRIPSRRTQAMDCIPSPNPDSSHGMSHRGGGCGQVSLQEHVPPALHNLIHALGYGVVPAMRYTTTIQQVQELAPEERDKLSAVTGEYVFRLSKYYHSLIDWDDPDD